MRRALLLLGAAALVAAAAREAPASVLLAPHVFYAELVEDFVVLPETSNELMISLDVAILGADNSACVTFHGSELILNESLGEAGIRNQLFVDDAPLAHSGDYITIPLATEMQESVNITVKVPLTIGAHTIANRVTTTSDVTAGGFYGSEPQNFSASLSAFECE